ncbi:hypothetical protein DUT91_20830 [Phyllobacterium salinisoli]|uniref:Uncharacterized protein n=1 Tax=Phyllobacterium salinisoli TaxID=1899321 RepID=A0A368K0L6_9HYPH|nr:DUF6105 family protein [Phyllobacterium salinisoli]RCS21993.1 hypothetical protein DUT91_20830 [Phyllobacterium salinisoli]
MRYLLIFWAGPLALFWGWYFLSLNDISFGTTFFSREMNDLVFEVYGNVLGIDPQAIPPLAARACVIDSLILFAIIAFRRRRDILARFQAWRERYS